MSKCFKFQGSKITGGRNGFSQAIDKAFYGEGQQMHDPEIRYTPDRGFHVEPKSWPMDDECLYFEQAFYYANTGAKSVKISDYIAVRARILNLEFAY